MRDLIAAVGLIALSISPAHAQKLGKGGIGIDETTEVPRCDRPLGTVTLVESAALLARPRAYRRGWPRWFVWVRRRTVAAPA